MSVEMLINQALQQAVGAHQGRGLWLLDEHPVGCPQQCPEGLALLTNRYDVYRQFQQQGWPISFSDLDFSQVTPRSLDSIYYRISKEKPLVNWVINNALKCLAPQGQLILVGAKSEGLKGYYDRVKSEFADAELQKLGKGAFLARLAKGEQAELNPLDDKNYAELRPVLSLGQQDVYSKPGVFGWEKEDAGSALLAQSWQELPGVLVASRVLDLGCGYGYLSLQYWSQRQQLAGDCEITATDSNAAAIGACTRNFAEFSVPGQVIAADCADEVAGDFDLILCNPPFHQGFGVEGQLTDRFLAATRRLLSKKGQALFVVNRFIPLAKKAEPLFSEVETYADNGAFKLIRLAGAKA